MIIKKCIIVFFLFLGPLSGLFFMRNIAAQKSKTLFGSIHRVEPARQAPRRPLDLESIQTRYRPHPAAQAAPTYPWNSYSASFSPITKEYFRCKGSPLNPPLPIRQDGKIVENIFDCGGHTTHSLPIRNGREFIYPILIDLLNHIQKRAKKAVVITSGHRCPAHNRYVDQSQKNLFSKHLIGAEVSFYITNMGSNPEQVIHWIEEFYTELAPRRQEGGQKQSSMAPLSRNEQEKELLTKPWLNQEIYIKWFSPHEGRNRDNPHPYGYFSIQVRFDRDRQLKVVSTPDASESYERY